MTSVTMPKSLVRTAPSTPAPTTTTPEKTITETTATTGVQDGRDRSALARDGVDTDVRRRTGGLPARATAVAPTATAVPRRGLGGSTTLPPGLSEAARAAITAALEGDISTGAHSAVRSLLGSSELRGLSTTAQTTLLETLATEPGTNASAATRLLSSTTFRAATPEVREQMVHVHGALDEQGRAALVALSADQRLENRDFTANGSTLTHLHRLATGPLAARLDRRALLSSTVTEIADPSTIEQQGQASCVPTSVSLELARRSPAEYARLVSGLASPAGDVSLRDGKPLTRAAGSIATTWSGRSPSERLLQDAFIEFGNGRFAYDVDADTHRTVDGESVGGGLNIVEAARLQSSVFAERYDSISTRGRTIARDGTQRDVNAANFKNTVSRLTFKRAENAPINRLRDEVAAGHPTLAAMRWSVAGDDTFHAVTVDRIDDDRVYFRNPHGGAWHGQAAGSALTDPPRRFEGGNVESMELAEFRSRLDSVSWPR